MSSANFEYDSKAFNAWVESAQAPAIQGTLRIYNAAQRLGVRVFFLTGRPEAQRASTETNLRLQGFSTWQELILRKPEQAKLTALATNRASERRLPRRDIGSSSTLAISGAICAASRRGPNCQSSILTLFTSSRREGGRSRNGGGKKTGEASQEVELSHRGLMARTPKPRLRNELVDQTLLSRGPTQPPRPGRKNIYKSMNSNVARTSLDAYRWSSTMHLANNMVLVKRSLHGHFLISVYRAGPCRRVEREAGVAGPEFDAA